MVSAVVKGKGKGKAILDDDGDGDVAEEEEEEVQEQEHEQDIVQKAREMAEMCRQQEEEDRQDCVVLCDTYFSLKGVEIPASVSRLRWHRT